MWPFNRNIPGPRKPPFRNPPPMPEVPPARNPYAHMSTDMMAELLSGVGSVEAVVRSVLEEALAAKEKGDASTRYVSYGFGHMRESNYTDFQRSILAKLAELGIHTQPRELKYNSRAGRGVRRWLEVTW